MPEVFFVNVNLREGINTDQITSARRKLVSSTACSSCSPLWTINDCLYNCVTLCALHRNNILIFLSRSVIPPVSRSNLVFVVLLFLCHALFCLCYTVFFVFVFLHVSRSFLLITSHSVLLHMTRSPWSVCIQKCFYCRSTASGKDNGACVQCCAGKCAVSFHVTCLVLAGFALEPSDWPQPTETYCERHQRTRFKVSSLCCTCNKRFSTE